jgi:hypothetical protein
MAQTPSRLFHGATEAIFCCSWATGYMLTRLTNSIRIRTGRLLALVYLLCVLAPAAALAVGNPAPCFPAEADSAGMMGADEAGLAHYMHEAGSHDHAGMHADSGHNHHHHDGKTSPGPCCAMLCLSAIPADLPSIAKPLRPIALLVAMDFRPLASEPPPPLYRPPIA